MFRARTTAFRSSSSVDRGNAFLGSASAGLGLFLGFPEDEHEGGVESALFGISRVSRRATELARLCRAFYDLGVRVVLASDAVVEVRLDDLLTALGGSEFDAA